MPDDAPESLHTGCSLNVFKPLFTLLTTIKKSPIKRMKVTEGVKNLMFNYHNHLQEIKDNDVIGALGKALIETNFEYLVDVLDEGVELRGDWMTVYEKRNEIKVDLGEYQGRKRAFGEGLGGF